MKARTGARQPVRRPADRRQQIVSAASRLFVEHGYHNVALADVANAVGIRAPSLYRHFKNKQDLLLQVVSAHIDTSVRLVEGAPDLDTVFRDSAARGVAERGSATLWQREVRNLSDDERASMRAGVIRTAERIADLVGAERPELGRDDAELLAWAAMSVFGSVATHRVTLPRRGFEELLVRLALSVAHARLGAAAPDKERAVDGDGFLLQLGASTSRERLLTEAVRLFDERGFQSVSNIDIGLAAGVSGPSIYKHFESKTDLLVAAVLRASERRNAITAAALAHAHSPQERLDGLLAGYVEFALEHSHLLGVLISELDQLPDRERRASQQARRDQIGLWCELLEQVRPGLDGDEARITVSAALCVVDDVVRTVRTDRRPDLADRLVEVCRAILSPDHDRP